MGLNITDRDPESHDSVRDVLHKQLAQTQASTFQEGENIPTSSPALLVQPSTPYQLAVSAGQFVDHRNIHSVGHNGAVPNGSFADIWEGPTTLYPWQTAASTIRVKAGGNINDTFGGSGAQTILVVGLDENFDFVSETILLAGVSASAATTITFIRINFVLVTTAGTFGGTNINAISVESVGTGDVIGYVSAGNGQSHSSMISIAAGQVGFVLDVSVTVATGSNKDADLHFCARPNANLSGPVYGATRILDRYSGIQNTNRFPFLQPTPVIGPADFWLEAQGNGAVTSVTTQLGLTALPEEEFTSPA